MKTLKQLKKSGINWYYLAVKTLQSINKLNYMKIKILDVGALDHDIEQYLPKGTFEYHSLDFKSYNKGQTYIHDLNSSSPIPIESNKYPIIVCLETLEHCLYPHKVMQELMRIGQPRALFLMSLPNDYNIIMRLYYLFGIKKAVNPAFTIVEEKGHIHTLRKKDIIDFYERYLDIEEIHYSFCLRETIVNGKMGWLNAIFNFLAPILPSLFARNISVAGRSKKWVEPYTK